MQPKDVLNFNIFSTKITLIGLSGLTQKAIHLQTLRLSNGLSHLEYIRVMDAVQLWSFLG